VRSTRSTRTRLAASWATRARRCSALLLVGGAAALGGCDEISGPEDAAVGAYSLRSVDDVSLPVIIEQRAGYTKEIIGGVISLNADGTFSDRLITREVSGSLVVPRTDTIIGTYSRTNDLLTFTATVDNSRWNGTINGVTLVQIISGLTLVYRR
jgi:hypothetical protein